MLVRLHSHPLGEVDLPLPAQGLAPGEVRRAIEARVGAEVASHLGHDGSASAAATSPACLAARRAVFADPPEVTVVVPTRDRPELLSHCLDSVLACEYPPGRREVLVADNAPSDSRTRDLVERSYGEHGVSYLLAARAGSSSARNAAAARANAEIVAFVDDDLTVDRHWLAELVAGFHGSGDVSCVTGLVVAAELDTWAQQLFEEYGGFSAGFAGATYSLRSPPDNPLFPFNPGILGSGNNVAFRRAALLDAGGYDPCLGNGTPARAGEDWELFLRLLRGGHSASYRPSALARHRHRRGFDELVTQLRDYGAGISGAITRTVVHEPGAVREIGRRLPAAMRYALSPRSLKNRNRSNTYPRVLRRAELAGLALGPARYLRSRGVSPFGAARV